MKSSLIRKFALLSVALALLATQGLGATSSVLGENPKLLAANSKHISDTVLQVKFAESADVNLINGKFVSASGQDLSAINDTLDASKVKNKARLFNASPDQINAQRKLIKQRTGKTSPDLNGYYRVQLNQGQNASEVSRQLATSPNVEKAYAEPLPAPAPVSPSFVSQQKHLTAAPAGMGITAGSTFPGSNGANVNIADLEYSWNSAHEDITKSRASGARLSNGAYPVDPFNDTNHGTAVAGIISGDKNTYGVNGIAPGASLKLVNTYSNDRGWDIANAIYLAQANLGPGDVILIEQQTWGPIANSLVPVEWVPSAYDAIKMATDNGQIVIEAAANSGLNLDDPIYGTSFPEGKADSGAIIVGAGAACGYNPDRSRMSFSNYGSRVNVQGYGECVVSAGYGNLYSGSDANTWYTGYFSGTSSASALVAGLTASLSSSYEQINGISPTAAKMRDLLYRSGTSQDTSTDAGNIGPLPNLVLAQQLSDTTSPAASTLTAKLNSNNKVVLNWSAAADNTGVASYKIYRNGVLLTTKSGTSLTHTDTTVAKRTNYSYKIVAVDKSNNSSAYSNTATIRTR